MTAYRINLSRLPYEGFEKVIEDPDSCLYGLAVPKGLEVIKLPERE